ncbi:hypothetical protein F511_24077 [Dorcoceras hygrometricum]|uniref:Uncharacterized protein n=1 Tax=Dorcoceras hygrometricum TaxID=472368 RepID=A0A2Z7BK39_9LAMI|nr:hypothetical protein F511_24077 [Dorcoceras hygrometricum]
MILVDGSWIIQEGGDFWKTIPRPAACSQWELLPQRQNDDTLAPISESFKIIRKRWADVCIEVVQFSAFNLLQPVGLHNFCRALVVRGSVRDLEVDPTEFCGVFRGLEQWFTEILEQQVRTYQGLFANVRQEVQLQKAALSLEILESRRKQQSQRVVLSQDMDSKSAETKRRNIRISIYKKTEYSHKHSTSDVTFQDQEAALSNYLMELRVQAQENNNTLTSQFSELVDYINRGGDAKKGEGSSSQGPQPPPDDRSRPGSKDSSRGRGRGSRSEPARKRGGGSSHRRVWR